MTTSGITPDTVEDLTYAITSISTTNFVIGYQKESRNLGFNIAVISQEMPTENLKHGVIYDCTEEGENQTSSTSGITVPANSCGTSGPFNATNSLSEGVKIEFDSPHFYDIPSVVVTPFIPNWDAEGLPKCFVESITKTFARVKCYLVYQDSGEFTFRQIPFTFAAVERTK